MAGHHRQTMHTFIGLDGYPGGWVAAYLEKTRQRFHYAANADRLLDVPHERAMIDIPIGLPQRGYRDCDRAARELLGPSAFLGARWGVWDFDSFDAANTYYRSAGEICISQQLWHLRSKLKEVNEAMTPEKQKRVQETHPELVFWRLNQKQPLKSKKTRDGRSRRIGLLKEHGVSRIEEWLAQRFGTGIRRDDLTDACACAIAARDSRSRLPSNNPPSERGIRMEIWY
jgi:predicted RNase H-like nuclease